MPTNLSEEVSNDQIAMTEFAAAMTLSEAAAVAGVHRHTLRKWLRQGKLRAVRTPSCWRITQEDLAGFMQWYQGEHDAKK